MAVKQCRFCGVANGDIAGACYNCGGVFRDAPAPRHTPDVDRSAALDPTNHLLRQTLRKQHARATCIALSSAAFFCGVRAVIMPVLVEYLPPQYNDHASPMEIRITSLCLAMMFSCMALWSRREAFLASVSATLIYLAFIIPDIVAYPVLLGTGHLGKIVVMLILARALATGLLHRHVGPAAVS